MALVVKLGSSIVTADDGSLREDVVEGVCAQVGALAAAGERVVMVTSGAIARGVREMGMAARPRAMDELQAASAVGQGPLFRAYQDRLAAHGVRAAQVLLTAGDIAARTNYLNARGTLRRLVDWGVVPVINENDTTATDEITFGDNDFLGAQVAILLDARLLVLLTDIDGLHTADPRLEPGAELVAEVESFGDLGALAIGDNTSPFGSGGMRSKVAAAEMACESGIPAVICNGTVEGNLAAAAAGDEVGTRFRAQPATASGFKLWLKYAKPPEGSVVVDAGAARVLRDAGSSLLPVGVTDVRGTFEAGAAVAIVDSGGAELGKGISSYSAAELGRIKGLKTAEVRELMPHASEEAVHRDRFVLT